MMDGNGFIITNGFAVFQRDFLETKNFCMRTFVFWWVFMIRNRWGFAFNNAVRIAILEMYSSVLSVLLTFHIHWPPIKNSIILKKIVISIWWVFWVSNKVLCPTTSLKFTTKVVLLPEHNSMKENQCFEIKHKVFCTITKLRRQPQLFIHNQKNMKANENIFKQPQIFLSNHKDQKIEITTFTTQAQRSEGKLKFTAEPQHLPV